MARTIDYLTFMVDVTPYEHEGNNYNALNIIVSYRKGQGFVCSWQPVLRTSMGYQTGPLPSRDPLVGGGGFVVKLASRNSVKVLEQMRTNLEVAKEGVKFYFDQRDFDALKNFMGDVANGGYPHDLETKIKNLINTTMATKNMTNNNESANVQNAQVSNPANETPMSKQFKQLKEKNPGALLLFRCGDFYESYEDDAKVVSDVLGITLTKSTETGVQMAGFPHHALDTYLPKIIRAGHRVAICDQLESEELRVKSEESATAAEPAEEPVSEQPVDDPAPSADEDVIDTTANDLPQVQFSTYKTKKGGTAPQIIGFGGEDDPRWKAHKDAGHKWVSASYRRDLNGNKVYILLFGTRYMDVAKALAGAYNTNDVDAWHRAEDACTAIYEQAQRDGKARWEAKKAEWKQKAEEKKAQKAADEQAKKCYTKEDVAAMLNAIMSDKKADIPEDIKALLAAA